MTTCWNWVNELELKCNKIQLITALWAHFTGHHSTGSSTQSVNSLTARRKLWLDWCQDISLFQIFISCHLKMESKWVAWQQCVILAISAQFWSETKIMLPCEVPASVLCVHYSWYFVQKKCVKWAKLWMKQGLLKDFFQQLISEGWESESLIIMKLFPLHWLHDNKLISTYQNIFSVKLGLLLSLYQ